MDSPVNRPHATPTEQLFSLIWAELVEFHGSQMGVWKRFKDFGSDRHWLICENPATDFLELFLF
jgi:hypothetical protein